MVNERGSRDTTLTAYFKANEEYPQARDVLYPDFPSKFVYQKNTRKWKPRKKGDAIGRMYYCHPTAGERFYLRTLLSVVKGARSFLELRTVPGSNVPCASYHEACLKRGLLEDDSEWKQCLEEAGDMATGRQLRDLFATILRECSPSNPAQLWIDSRHKICDDLRHRVQVTNVRNDPTEEEVYDYGLYLIEGIHLQRNKSLANCPGMPQPQHDWAADFGNRLIAEQQNYDPVEQHQLADERIPSLNTDQHSAFNEICHAVETKSGQIFFLHGPGGTGKTYVYSSLCHFLRSQGKIVLCVASSGIASLLLPGGQTAHTTFKIPIQIHESSHCGIKCNANLAELLQVTDLIIWDEAPMQHRHIHKHCGHCPKSSTVIL